VTWRWQAWSKLLIIDEVHLLNDERGPVIETLVARTLRQVGLADGQMAGFAEIMLVIELVLHSFDSSHIMVRTLGPCMHHAFMHACDILYLNYIFDCQQAS